MDTTSQLPKGHDALLSALNVAIEGLNLAKEISSITPAKAVFGSVSVLLVMIKDSMANTMDYVELGLACAGVCKALDRGMNGGQADRFSRFVFEAIEELTTTVAEIERNVLKLGKRNAVSRVFHSKNDKEKIAVWRTDLNRILHVFNTELAINTHGAVLNTQNIVSDIHRTLVEPREGTDGGDASKRPGTPGELPPPPPRVCFGREELINNVLGLAENLTPIALIGAGGIGKTSVSLAVLHHDRIKSRFGDNRRFIRCDQFPASCAHFLARLSKVIGAGVENPEDLIPLRPSLSSKEVLIVLDNAESILDPQGANGREIYGVVEELSRFNNVCLIITSRITVIPPNCETLKIPTLSTGAAHDAFYNIYKYGGKSESVDEILRQLDYHPLSVTLLATVAHQNQWDDNRLTREWNRHRTGVLRTEYQASLASAIELSLSSPMFKDLGPDARGLLEVIAFYPQGVNENNLDWLFPTTPNVTRLLDKFCIISLTYRSNEFTTMLAPLRDHLRPHDPRSSSLLCATKDRYFARMPPDLDPNRPGFEDARWIVSEDVNVEHLLDIFVSADPDSIDIWDACINFIRHLSWHKPRQTVLIPKIEALPDSHLSKPKCLFGAAELFGSVGNVTEKSRLLTHTLRLERERGDDFQVASTLFSLANSSRLLGSRNEGIHQAKEASEIYERLGNTVGHAHCLNQLAVLLFDDGQLDAAEEAVVHSIELLPAEGEEYKLCHSHQILGDIYGSKGEREKGIRHFNLALGIASTFNWAVALFWTNLLLTELFLAEDEFDDAYSYLKQAETHAVDNPYGLGRVALLQAKILYRQRGLEDATSEFLRAVEIFEKVGASQDVEICRSFLQDIEGVVKSRSPLAGRIPV